MAEKSKEHVIQQTATASARTVEPQAGNERTPAALLFDLQRTHGNRYVQDVLRGAVVQRKCDCGGSCQSCRDQELTVQRRAGATPQRESQASSVWDVLNSPGFPLDSFAIESMQSRFNRSVVPFQIHSPVGSATQTKMEISQPGDASEREADEVADRVMRMPEPQSAIGSSLAHDFSNVRVHTNSRAAESARDMGALAYTVGRDIVFGAGQYAPETESGQRLLAHELTHVMQQNGSTVGARIQRQGAGAGAGAAPAPAPAPAPPAEQLSDEMLTQIARRLREAMEGLGTDEDAIYAALTGRTEAQIQAISAKYQEMYGRALMADLRDELNESELEHALVITGASPLVPGARDPAEAAAAELRRAMKGLGTDESSIFAVLTGRTQAERTAIKEAYRRLTNNELEADLRDELSGADLNQAVMLLNQGMLQPEDEIYLAMAGLGTDEDRLFRVLSSMRGNQASIEALDRSYRDKYGDLTADLRSDLNADEYRRARQILGPFLPDVSFEDCSPGLISMTRAAFPIAIQQLDRAISVLGAGWARMSVAEQGVFRQYFDPSNSGDIDAGFVGEVLVNFRSIRRRFDGDFDVECEATGGLCGTQRYAYAWDVFGNTIHICPPFATTLTTDAERARGLIHEATHNALSVLDRAYYSSVPGSDFSSLTPRGPWAAQIPIVGPVIGAIWRTDTLNNPDSYARFAYSV